MCDNLTFWYRLHWLSIHDFLINASKCIFELLQLCFENSQYYLNKMYQNMSYILLLKAWLFYLESLFFSEEELIGSGSGREDVWGGERIGGRINMPWCIIWEMNMFSKKEIYDNVSYYPMSFILSSLHFWKL